MKIVAPELPGERYPEFVAAYRRHFLAREDAMRLFAGMRELLERLSRERSLAIATGKSRKGLERSLEATGVRRLFAASRCADETTPKPHPAMLFELMRELNAEPGGVLMIGDTSHDLEMARAAGVDAPGRNLRRAPGARAARLRTAGLRRERRRSRAMVEQEWMRRSD